MNLEFEINGQILKRIDSQEDIVNKNYNFYECRFTFEEDSEWIQVNKFVIFLDGWGNSSTVHLGNAGSILSCVVPNKMLKGSYFKISVYGGNLLSTNNVTIPLKHSGYNRPHNNHCGGGGYKDVFVEIFDRLDETVNSIVYDNKCLHLFGKDGLIESVYVPFVTEEETRTIANTIMEDYVNRIPLVSEENAGLLSSEDKLKLDSIEDGANRTIVDDELDYDSDNPISNKVVTLALDSKENSYDFVKRIDELIVNLINKEN